MTAQQIERHNRALARAEGDEPIGQVNLDEMPDATRLAEQVKTRLSYMQEKLIAKTYVNQSGKSLAQAEIEKFAPPETLPALDVSDRVATQNTPLHCGPRIAGLYKEPVDLDFDRNRCSMVRPGERVQLLAKWGELFLARTPYAMGWIANDAKLEPYDKRSIPSEKTKALTYRALVEEAFGYHGKPYGWGGREGAQDCSRFLMDVFEPFGIKLPRHSGRQALAGSYSVSLDGVTSRKERIGLLAQAAEDGIVLLHFPGHIMLYLGQNEAREPMAIHAFSEYLERCPEDGSDVVVRADRVAVSDLTLGQNSSRRSFLDRITILTVLGPAPAESLRGAASLRPAVERSDVWEKLTRGAARKCRDDVKAALFRSPTPVHSEASARVIATLEKNPGFAELFLQNPDGDWERAPSELMGGPPYTYVTTIDKPAKGRWAAVVADGEEVLACERFNVRRSALEPKTHDETSPRTWGAWPDSWKWEQDTENMYSAFVERLFDEPKSSDTTWPNLHSLLRDPARNLLHNHLGLDEDEQLELGPDCADLPYFLRAYFAWKMRLPFGYRRCSRGQTGTPPACNELHTNREPLFDSLRSAAATGFRPTSAPATVDESETEAASPPSREELERNNQLSEVEAFKLFSRKLASGVHSASARTAPTANATDVYPVALNRRALKPGTVFADPYGHLLVVAKWWPQTANEYGVLIGADAQPDGTIGRRRFWRGTFLFTPKTDDVGAGFKAWRPIAVADEEPSDTLISWDNEALQKPSPFARYSLEQYASNRDAFYAKIEALINPRPLDPAAYMSTLVDALDESVKRRIVSVDNGIQYMKENNWSVIEMPNGHDIFETEGPWEDYSTPARDLRLLISLDAVLQFPEQVAADPKRFGVAEADALSVKKRLRDSLGLLLAARRYRYVLSNGKPKELRLADIAERAQALELAYNPNDCIEVRWGAPRNSDEHSSCVHRAPKAQQEKMSKYRIWFHQRERPPR